MIFDIVDAICEKLLSSFCSILILDLGCNALSNCMSKIVISTRINKQPVNRSWSCTQLKLVKFSHKWTINNFSYYLSDKKPKKLSSPIFNAEGNGDIELCLDLYTNGEYSDYNTEIGLYLRLISCKKSDHNVKCKLYLIDNNGKKACINNHQVISGILKEGYRAGFKIFLKRFDLLQRANELIPDDKLTILCEGTMSIDTINVSGKDESMEFNPLDMHGIGNDLGCLLETENLSDVTLLVSGMEFRAHKAILAARSPVFLAMFEHAMEEQQQNRVVIINIDHNVFREMLQYVYSDRVPNLENMAESLLAAADKYALGNLKSMCEVALSKKLSKKNAIQILMFADLHGSDGLKRQAINVINAHANEIANTLEFKLMMDSHPRLLAEVYNMWATSSQIT